MKKYYVILLLLSCLNVYSQTRITGATTVNPAKVYGYFGFLSGVDGLMNVTWHVINGRFNNPDGPTSLTQTAGNLVASVVWDDAETGKLFITLNSVSYVSIDVKIINGVKDMYITDFTCNGVKVGNTIDVPLGQTGTLDCRVPDMPYASGYITTFQWSTPKSWGGSTFSAKGNINIKYDADSGNNETISVTPIGYRGVLGNTKTVTIRRATPVFDGNITNVTISSNKTYEHSKLYLKDVVIKSGANVTLNGYNSVRIVPGFTAEAGSTVRIYNGKSSKSMANEYRAPEYEATNMDLLNIETPYLRQNIPNPFADETILSCFIPENAISSYIQINGILGNIIKKIPITLRGENQVLINGRELGSGIYTYSLIIDGRLIDTKRMIVK